jgi:hypothetical protein
MPNWGQMCISGLCSWTQRPIEVSQQQHCIATHVTRECHCNPSSLVIMISLGFYKTRNTDYLTRITLQLTSMTLFVCVCKLNS